MIVKVPFHLRRRQDARSALGFHWATPDARGVLAACADFGLSPVGRVFAVAGGLLLKLDEPSRKPWPGACRLFALGKDLFIPVDADLIPALLDDEVEGMTRARGLLFLPPDRAYAYDPARPAAPRDLLVGTARPPRSWKPLPEEPGPAERLVEIFVDLADDSSEDLLALGGAGVATEPPRPPQTDASGKIVGGATFGAGLGMAWLGNKLGMERLSAAGSRWLARAVAHAPRLSEALLGRQAAALRTLLQEFRDGKLDDALRHALPLGEVGTARGAATFPGDRLPPHGTSFSLRELLEPPSHRRPGTWYGEADVMAELAREYRKAAEESTRRGDHRRAAFIYGRLLRDWRAAVNALVRGALHREAATLLLAKLDDRPGAARAFEAAGELDRALQLYREVGDHEAAGDLLRRLGEDDEALAEYQQEAAALAKSNSGYLAAGELLLNKAGRPDLAEAVFREGWSNRPRANATACALRAAALAAERGDATSVVALVDEADEFFATPGNDGDAGLFYNELARLARHDTLTPFRDECLDRALLGLAAKMRQRVGMRTTPAGVLSGLLRPLGEWPASVVADAEFAAAALLKGPPPGDSEQKASTARRHRVAVGTVTAACAAELTGEVFLGFAGGEVWCFRPQFAETLRVGAYGGSVAGLATEPEGRSVVVLVCDSAGAGTLAHCTRQTDGSYRETHRTTVGRLEAPLLTPVFARGWDGLLGLWDGAAVSVLSVPSFAKLGELTEVHGRVNAAFFVASPDGGDGVSAFLRTDGGGWHEERFPAGRRQYANANWQPDVNDTSTLRAPPLSVIALSEHAGRFLLVGLGRSGTLYWSDVLRPADAPPVFRTVSPPTPNGGFLAATQLPSGYVAAVARASVTWYRRGAERADTHATTHTAIPSAVACFASQPTRELVVVCRDGFIARVPYPMVLAT